MIRTVDGIVEFAKYEVSNGTYSHFAFDEQELSDIKERIEGVKWTVKKLNPSREKRNKAKGVKYTNCSEALDHLEKGKEPNHVRKERLEKDNENLKARVERLEKLLLGGN